MIRRALGCGVLIVIGLFIVADPVVAQVNMPDPREISGVPLPANDLPPGSVSVRVIRGSFANNLAGVEVEFIVGGGAATRKTTDADGRVLLEGLRRGARVKALATVGAERLESQEVTIGETGIRFVLAASDPDAQAREAEDRTLAAGPATRGTVVISPESRIIAELTDDRLRIFYLLRVMNTARTPVDLGGPLVIDLPQGARGASLMDDSAPSASVNGPRVTITSPFAPGATNVNVSYELPYSGPVARLEQVWPAASPQLAFFAVKAGEMDLASPQFVNKQSLVQQGQAVVAASIGALGQGQALVVDITGLPHHPTWPRNVALGATGMILMAGLWAAFGPSARRRRDS